MRSNKWQDFRTNLTVLIDTSLESCQLIKNIIEKDTLVSEIVERN